ncbi:LexA family transcriptional regulator [Acinetobacter towneri]|uniref:XRE family transcriptional regulator n=1 Tax=Acinetobacter TaxID=469 RepID=UPI0015D271B6|nr:MULTISPECIES: LexA family transcriptional regulator [Acinetobacter]MCA4780280.1 LexA family transcriptional regulator [Acinetobacter towneri]MCA4785662.1 LexA family transcriptional regulator [Acinetobacter towneri]MCA4787504.1 LexA family transcriptional regulator [Acinetobacter towneri]MCA4796786.1 LexA family transcriptional regulator [Acinetobacter towneri]MCA4801833.1 LexA family transcriptional regulator [Acinetobacter towneri]
MLKDRLKLARKNAKKSQQAVADAIGVTQSAYSQLETGRVDSSSFLPAIAKFLGVDAYWLQTGKESEKFDPFITVDSVVATEDYKDEFIWIDVVEAVFSCGVGESIEFHFDTINGKIPFSPSFMKDKNVTDKTMKIIKAKGDSMADYIKDGDLVGINLAQTEIIDGEIYAVYLAGEGMLKQIFKEANGSLVLHSLNPRFPDKIVSEENGKNFKIMGRQFWRAG